MDIEQPSLGTIGCDALSVTAGWSWEKGWHAAVSWRRSGSAEFDTVRFDGLDSEEAFDRLSGQLSELLGLDGPAPF